MIWDYWEGHRNKKIAVVKIIFDPATKVACAFVASGIKAKKVRCDYKKFR